LLYWVVVHQVYSATGVDQPTITLRAYREFSNNVVTMRHGMSLRTNSFVYTGDMGNLTVAEGAYVIPLDGATGSINVAPTLYRQFHSIAWLRTQISASSDARGTFLVMIPVYGSNPGLIWGNEYDGETDVYLSTPSIMYVMLIVNIR
ncbi:MAG: hypothetical protein GSR87_00315, partial [Desulfurococcales archaeon]|nr:hypothetical protein [Desulfurococcales archaeon]